MLAAEVRDAGSDAVERGVNGLVCVFECVWPFDLFSHNARRTSATVWPAGTFAASNARAETQSGHLSLCLSTQRGPQLFVEHADVSVISCVALKIAEDDESDAVLQGGMLVDVMSSLEDP